MSFPDTSTHQETEFSSEECNDRTNARTGWGLPSAGEEGRSRAQSGMIDELFTDVVLIRLGFGGTEHFEALRGRPADMQEPLFRASLAASQGESSELRSNGQIAETSVYALDGVGSWTISPLHQFLGELYDDETSGNTAPSLQTMENLSSGLELTLEAASITPPREMLELRSNPDSNSDRIALLSYGLNGVGSWESKYDHPPQADSHDIKTHWFEPGSVHVTRNLSSIAKPAVSIGSPKEVDENALVEEKLEPSIAKDLQLKSSQGQSKEDPVTYRQIESLGIVTTSTEDRNAPNMVQIHLLTHYITALLHVVQNIYASMNISTRISVVDMWVWQRLFPVSQGHTRVQFTCVSRFSCDNQSHENRMSLREVVLWTNYCRRFREHDRGD